MPRYHNINGVKVQFTAEEETARDAEEQARADAAPARALACLLYTSPSPRDVEESRMPSSA